MQLSGAVSVHLGHSMCTVLLYVHLLSVDTHLLVQGQRPAACARAQHLLTSGLLHVHVLSTCSPALGELSTAMHTLRLALPAMMT
jgi:hypothetical protein